MGSRYRPPSPPRNRYHPPAGRTSASSFFAGSSYDPYAAPTRTSRDYISGPRVSDERVAAPRVLPPRTRSPPRRMAADDYQVPLRTQPRRATLEPEEARIRRPLSLISPTSPSRASRPVITSSMDRPPSPVTKVHKDRREEDYEVQPASSTSKRHHQRHSSLNISEPGRLAALDRDGRENIYRVPTSSKPAVRERSSEHDRNYGYEYTEPQETKLQDPMYRQRSRRESYDTTRPKSMILPDTYVPRSERAAGPPVSSRGFDNVGRSESQRQSHRSREEERTPRDYVREDRLAKDPGVDGRDRRPTRPEITLHQPTNDGYAPYPEESRHHRPHKLALEDDRLEPKSRPRRVVSEEDRLDPRIRDPRDDQLDRSSDDHPRIHRHRHKHHHHRDHDDHEDENERDVERRDRRERRAREEAREYRERPDDSGPSKATLAAGAAAAAGAGLAAREVQAHHRDRDIDREAQEKSEHRSARRPAEHLREPDRDHPDTSSVSTSLSISEREDLEYQEAREAERRAKEQAGLFTDRPVDQIIREQKSWERRPEDERPRHHRSYRPRRHHSRTRDQDSYSESSSSSSSDSDEDRVSRPPPRVVTPSNEEKSEPKPPPKGILRKPREQFPEYPATFREGAAPHKDDKKKDVPANARWTKIDRRLVNPEALEQDGIRFNEFVDHVIVLKVMDKEEIEKYTRKTAEIREKRRLLMGLGPGGPEGQQVHPPPQPVGEPF